MSTCTELASQHVESDKVHPLLRVGDGPRHGGLREYLGEPFEVHRIIGIAK